MRPGKLIGIGVGPGDPELVTVKAVRRLERVTVVACIAAAGRAGRAREIAAPYLKPGTREFLAVMPMTGDAAAAGRIYDQLATGIAAELGQGRDVAFLCEGDPLLYGSFVHLLERLRPGHEVEIVPGVTSVSAAAAAALRPLASREQPLTILPATLPSERLEAAIAACEQVAVIKLGRHLAKVRAVLAAAGMLEGAVLIENATLAAQRVRPLASVGEATAPYFSLILACRRDVARG